MLRHWTSVRERQGSFNSTDSAQGPAVPSLTLSLPPSPNPSPRTSGRNGVRFTHLHINHRPDRLKKPAGYNADPPITAEHRLRFLSRAPTKNSSHTTAASSVDSKKKKKKREFRKSKKDHAKCEMTSYSVRSHHFTSTRFESP